MYTRAAHIARTRMKRLPGTGSRLCSKSPRGEVRHEYLQTNQNNCHHEHKNEPRLESHQRKKGYEVGVQQSDGLAVDSFPRPRIDEELQGQAERLALIHIQLTRQESTRQAKQEDAPKEQPNHNLRRRQSEV